MISFFNDKYLSENVIEPNVENRNGIFTTLKYDNGTLFFGDEHIKRLKKSAKNLGINFPNRNYKNILLNLVRLNNMTSTAFKIILLEKARDSEIFIKCKSLPSKVASIKLISKIQHRSDRNLYINKCLHNQNYQNTKTDKEHYSETLFRNKSGEILETSIHNIFFIRKNLLLTPPLFLPILPGIIRGMVIKKMLSVSEVNININKLEDYDGAFVTNSLRGILAVEKIDDINYEIDETKNIRVEIERKIGLNL